MTPSAHIASAIRAMMAGYPDSHTNRVLEALKCGPRVRLTDLARHNKVHRVTVWRWIREGKLPHPRKDGHRLNTWDYSEVAEFLK